MLGKVGLLGVVEERVAGVLLDAGLASESGMSVNSISSVGSCCVWPDTTVVLPATSSKRIANSLKCIMVEILSLWKVCGGIGHGPLR